MRSDMPLLAQLLKSSILRSTEVLLLAVLAPCGCEQRLRVQGGQGVVT